VSVKRIQENFKGRFQCQFCRGKCWTSGLGQAVLIYTTKKLARESYIISYKLLIYTQKCKGCGNCGNIKAYEDEMERIATKFSKVLCTGLGYLYEKEEKSQRKGNPRSDH
jgi:hypothetical protein